SSVGHMSELHQSTPSTKAPRTRLAGRIDLSADESTLLRFLCGGMSNRRVADTLGTTLGMVKYRTNRLFSKLGVRNRVQAARRERRLSDVRRRSGLGAT